MCLSETFLLVRMNQFCLRQASLLLTVIASLVGELRVHNTRIEPVLYFESNLCRCAIKQYSFELFLML